MLIDLWEARPSVVQMGIIYWTGSIAVSRVEYMFHCVFLSLSVLPVIMLPLDAVVCKFVSEDPDLLTINEDNLLFQELVWPLRVPLVRMAF